MKHTTEIVPDKNHIVMSFDKKFCEDYISEHTSIPKIHEVGWRLRQTLLNIEGITDVIINKYECRITKGGVFNWSALLPEILNTVYRIAYHEEENTVAILPAGYECFKYHATYPGVFNGGFIDDAGFERSNRAPRDEFEY
jgi:hypothetical protein